MADLTAYTYPDGTPEDQLRHLKQLLVDTLSHKSVSTGSKTVVRQDPDQIRAEIKELEGKITRSNRMHTVYSVHARR